MNLTTLLGGDLHRKSDRRQLIVFDDVTARNTLFYGLGQPVTDDAGKRVHLTGQDLENVARYLTEGNKPLTSSSRIHQVGEDISVYAGTIDYTKRQPVSVQSPSEIYAVKPQAIDGQGNGLVLRVAGANSKEGIMERIVDLFKIHGYNLPEIEQISAYLIGEMPGTLNAVPRNSGMSLRKKAAIAAGALATAGLLYAAFHDSPDTQKRFNEAASTPGTNAYKALNPK